MGRFINSLQQLRRTAPLPPTERPGLETVGTARAKRRRATARPSRERKRPGCAGNEVGRAGKEVGRAGNEVGRAGKEVGRAGKEVGRAGKEVGRAGKEVGRAGKEVGRAGKETGGPVKATRGTPPETPLHIHELRSVFRSDRWRSSSRCGFNPSNHANQRKPKRVRQIMANAM